MASSEVGVEPVPKDSSALVAGKMSVPHKSERMFPFFVEAYPWDVVSRAGQQRLERLRGEVGITGVAICASTPPFAVMQRFDDTVGIVRSSGGLLYHPQGAAFSSLRCKPVTASIIEDPDAMSRALEVCDQLGLDVRFVASVLRCGEMARSYGELVAVNALGTKSRDCLCASHADVQAYAQSFAASLHDLKGDAEIVVSDMVSGCDDVLCVPRSCDAVSLGATEQGLLTWCFCGACVETAGREGIDAGQVRAAVRRAVGSGVDRGLHDECEHGPDASMDASAEAYWATHLRTVAKLFEATEVGGGGKVIFAEENICDVWASPERTLQVFAGSFDEFGEVSSEGGGHVEIVFPAGLALSGADLTAALRAAVDTGVRCVTVRHLAVIPEKAIQPLKQAVRFARRAVEA